MRPCKNCGRDISHRVKPGPGRPPEYCEEPDTFTITVPVTRRDVLDTGRRRRVDTGRRVERAYRLGTTRCQYTRENKRKAASDHRRIKANPERFGVPMGLPKRGGKPFVPDDGSGPRPLRAAGIVNATIAGLGGGIDTVPEVEPKVVERFTIADAEYTIIDLPAHRDDPGALRLAGRPEAVRRAQQSQDRLLRVLNPSGETVTPHRSPVVPEDEPADAAALDGVGEFTYEPVEAASRERTPGRIEFERWLAQDTYSHPAPFIPSAMRTTPGGLQRKLAERAKARDAVVDFPAESELGRAA
jgi:hypothetical protein